MIVLGDRHEEKRLAAFFTAAVGVDVDISQIKASIELRLPSYMLPTYYQAIIEMPVNSSGKIDKRALSRMLDTRNASRTPEAAFADPIIRKLTNIWKEVLDIDDILLHENFFDQGGNSLRAVRMFARIEQDFQKSIPLATLFEAGTIEKLAVLLRQDDWQEPESSIVPIQPNGTRPPFFCIHAKGGNVLFYRDLSRYLGDDQPFYGIQARVRCGSTSGAQYGRGNG